VKKWGTGAAAAAAPAAAPAAASGAKPPAASGGVASWAAKKAAAAAAEAEEVKAAPKVEAKAAPAPAAAEEGAAAAAPKVVDKAPAVKSWGKSAAAAPAAAGGASKVGGAGVKEATPASSATSPSVERAAASVPLATPSSSITAPSGARMQRADEYAFATASVGDAVWAAHVFGVAPYVPAIVEAKGMDGALTIRIVPSSSATSLEGLDVSTLPALTLAPGPKPAEKAAGGAASKFGGGGKLGGSSPVASKFGTKGAAATAPAPAPAAEAASTGVSTVIGPFIYPRDPWMTSASSLCGGRGGSIAALVGALTSLPPATPYTSFGPALTVLMGHASPAHAPAYAALAGRVVAAAEGGALSFATGALPLSPVPRTTFPLSAQAKADGVPGEPSTVVLYGKGCAAHAGSLLAALGAPPALATVLAALTTGPFALTLSLGGGAKAALVSATLLGSSPCLPSAYGLMQGDEGARTELMGGGVVPGAVSAADGVGWATLLAATSTLGLDAPSFASIVAAGALLTLGSIEAAGMCLDGLDFAPAEAEAGEGGGVRVAASLLNALAGVAIAGAVSVDAAPRPLGAVSVTVIVAQGEESAAGASLLSSLVANRVAFTRSLLLGSEMGAPVVVPTLPPCPPLAPLATLGEAAREALAACGDAFMGARLAHAVVEGAVGIASLLPSSSSRPALYALALEGSGTGLLAEAADSGLAAVFDAGTVGEAYEAAMPVAAFTTRYANLAEGPNACTLEALLARPAVVAVLTPPGPPPAYRDLPGDVPSLLFRVGAVAALDSIGRQAAAEAAPRVLAALQARHARRRFLALRAAMVRLQCRLRGIAARKRFLVAVAEAHRLAVLTKLMAALTTEVSALDKALANAVLMYGGAAANDVNVTRAAAIARSYEVPVRTALTLQDADAASVALNVYVGYAAECVAAIGVVYALRAAVLAAQVAATVAIEHCARELAAAMGLGVKSGAVTPEELSKAVSALPPSPSTDAVRAAFAALEVPALAPMMRSRVSSEALDTALHAFGRAIARLSTDDWESYAPVALAARSSATRAATIALLEEARRGGIAGARARAEKALSALTPRLNGAREAAGAAGVISWPRVSSALALAVNGLANGGVSITAMSTSLFGREDLSVTLVEGALAAHAEVDEVPAPAILAATLSGDLAEGTFAQFRTAVDTAVAALDGADAAIADSSATNALEVEALSAAAAGAASSSGRLRSLWATALAADTPASSPLPLPRLEAADFALGAPTTTAALEGLRAPQVRECVSAAVRAVASLHSAIRGAQRVRMVRAQSAAGALAPAGGAMDVDLAGLAAAIAVASDASNEAEASVRGEAKRRASNAVVRAQAIATLQPVADDIAGTTARALQLGLLGESAIAAAQDAAKTALGDARDALTDSDPFADVASAVAAAKGAEVASAEFAATVVREDSRRNALDGSKAEARRVLTSYLERFSKLLAGVEAGRRGDEEGVLDAVSKARAALRKATRTLIGSVDHPSLQLTAAELLAGALSSPTPSVSLPDDALAIASFVAHTGTALAGCEDVVAAAKAARAARESKRVAGVSALTLGLSRLTALRMSITLLELGTFESITGAVHAAEAAIGDALPVLNSTARVRAGAPLSTPRGYLDMDPGAISNLVETALGRVSAAEAAVDTEKARVVEADRLRRESIAAEGARREEDAANRSLAAGQERAERAALLVSVDKLTRTLTHLLSVRESAALQDCVPLARAIGNAEGALEAASMAAAGGSELVTAAAAVNAAEELVAASAFVLERASVARAKALERARLVDGALTSLAGMDDGWVKLSALASSAATVSAASKLLTEDATGGSGATDIGEGPYSDGRPVSSSLTDEERRFCGALITRIFADSASITPSPDALGLLSKIAGGLSGDRRQPTVGSPSSPGTSRAQGAPSTPPSASSPLRPTDVELTPSETAAAIAQANLSLPPLGSPIDPLSRAQAVSLALIEARERKAGLITASRRLPPVPAAAFLADADRTARAVALITSVTGRAIDVNGAMFPLPPIIRHFMDGVATALTAAKAHAAEHIRSLRTYNASLGLGLSAELAALGERLGERGMGLPLPREPGSPRPAASPTRDQAGEASLDAMPCGSSDAEMSNALTTASQALTSCASSVEAVKTAAEGRTNVVWAIRKQRLALSRARDVCRSADRATAELDSAVAASIAAGELPSSLSSPSSAGLASPSPSAAAKAAVATALDMSAYARAQLDAMTPGTDSEGRGVATDALIEWAARIVAAHVAAVRAAGDVYAEQTAAVRVLRTRGFEPAAPVLAALAAHGGRGPASPSAPSPLASAPRLSIHDVQALRASADAVDGTARLSRRSSMASDPPSPPSHPPHVYSGRGGEALEAHESALHKSRQPVAHPGAHVKFIAPRDAAAPLSEPSEPSSTDALLRRLGATVRGGEAKPRYATPSIGREGGSPVVHTRQARTPPLGDLPSSSQLALERAAAELSRLVGAPGPILPSTGLRSPPMPAPVAVRGGGAVDVRRSDVTRALAGLEPRGRAGSPARVAAESAAARRSAAIASLMGSSEGEGEEVVITAAASTRYGGSMRLVMASPPTVGGGRRGSLESSPSLSAPVREVGTNEGAAKWSGGLRDAGRSKPFRF